MNRLLIVVAGCVLAVGMVQAAGTKQPSPGDFYLDFGAGRYAGPFATIALRYEFGAKQRQAVALTWMYGQLDGTSQTTHSQICPDPDDLNNGDPCAQVHSVTRADDRRQQGIALTYSVRVGSIGR